mgnify:CR=1 FL=1
MGAFARLWGFYFFEYIVGMVQVIVRVTPNSRKEEFTETGHGEYSLLVREKAQGNQANHRVREVIANHFRVPVRLVRIITGHRGRKKRLEVLE